MGLLRFSAQAHLDLVEIGDYIAQDSAETAARFVRRLEDHCTLLSNRPLMGRPRDEIRPGLRSVRYGRYAIFYRAIEGGVEIARVIHSARDLDTALGKR